MLKQVRRLKAAGLWILFSRDVVLAEQVFQLHGELREFFRPLGMQK